MKIVEQNQLELMFVVQLLSNAEVPLQYCSVIKTTKISSSCLLSIQRFNVFTLGGHNS